MGSISENQQVWGDHAWILEGHEWSPGGTRLGTEMLWWRSLRPRLHALLPTAVILEIGPGFGRWTEYLLRESHQLIGIDVTERCVNVCRERFAGRPARFAVNDGNTLPTITDGSISAAFSFDSLVHAEGPQVTNYLLELARCLKPGGLGFFHHSNLGAYADRTTGSIPRYVPSKGWRALTVSARSVREACRAAGLECLTQELITWRIRGNRAYRISGEQLPLSDCFSLFRRPRDGDVPQLTKVYVNRRFVAEWDQVTLLAELYSVNQGDAPSEAMYRAAGQPGLPKNPWRYARARLRRRILALRDPFSTTLRADRCPDCGGRLVPHEGAMRCDACLVLFVNGTSNARAAASRDYL